MVRPPDPRHAASLVRIAATAEWCRDGIAADAALRGGGFDLCVLDLGLPGRDGLALLGGARDRGHLTLVLVLTARDAVEDRSRGFDFGADD